MTQIIEILEYLRNYPLFDNITLSNKLNKGKKYTNLFLYRLIKKKRIFRIEKNKYTVYDDPLLIASRIRWPSYITCWSAIKFHNLTEQIPNYIWVGIKRYKKPIEFFNTKIIFVKINNNNFFGYEKLRYNNFEIFMAEPEKAIIDSMLLKKVSYSEIRDIISSNLGKLSINKFLKYLKRIGNKSLIKRFGYLFESLGKDYHDKLKKYIDATYISLDFSKKKVGEKNKKWRLIINA